VLVLLQSPSLLDQAVVHDDLLGDAGGLQQDQPGSLNKVKRGGGAGPAAAPKPPRPSCRPQRLGRRGWGTAAGPAAPPLFL
jgi:hypothetical protein